MRRRGTSAAATQDAATSSLLATLAELRESAGPLGTDRGVVLLAVTVTNGAEIAACYGSRWLDLVTEEVLERLRNAAAPTRVRVLPEDPWGGFLAALVVDRDHIHTQVATTAEAMRGIVDLDHDLVWPVVTVRAQELGEGDDVWVAAGALRSAVWAAGRQDPGTLTWQHSDDDVGGGLRGDLRDDPFAFSGSGSTTDELLLVRDLAACLASYPEEIQLAFQPVHDLRLHRAVGAESLLRWTHPTRGAVSAFTAVTAAERTGLILPLGRLVLERAVTHLAHWLPTLDEKFVLHVNVSPLELRDPGYVDHLEAVLTDAGVEPGHLMLELTETALTEGPDIGATLSAIQELGCKIGVDDFGTGYSSISLLTRLGCDAVKIDRSLVRDVATDPAAFTTARAVLALVAALGVAAVAEGIETALQASHLQAMGCRFGQGYHLGRPAPPEVVWGTPQAEARALA